VKCGPLAAILFGLAACSTTPEPSTIVYVLEGNVASYPAFLAKARECDFSAFKFFPDGWPGPHYLVTFPYPLDGPSKCIAQWVEANPQTGLRLSAH
jgi:hypothetical protein